MTWIILGIIAGVLISAFFSGTEIGFYSLNRLRLQSRVEAGWPGARTLNRLLSRPNVTLMTFLIGSNVALYAGSALATDLFGGRRHPELIATLLMAPIVFLFGEMLPKDIFRRNCDLLMYPLARPIQACQILFWPALFLLRGLAAFIEWIIPGEPRQPTLSRAALQEWIAEGAREGVLSPYQQSMAANVMDLLRKRIASVMIPIHRVVIVAAELSGEELRKNIRFSSHSRLPVLEDGKKIVGILHALDYICAQPSGRTAKELARPVIEVNATDAITPVLVALQKQRQQMAVVLDDDRRPVGIVTMRDLIAEIVGELPEPY